MRRSPCSNSPTDSWIEYTLEHTLVALEPQWNDAFQAGTLAAGNERAQEFIDAYIARRAPATRRARSHQEVAQPGNSGDVRAKAYAALEKLPGDANNGQPRLRPRVRQLPQDRRHRLHVRPRAERRRQAAQPARHRRIDHRAEQEGRSEVRDDHDHHERRQDRWSASSSRRRKIPITLLMAEGKQETIRDRRHRRDGRDEPEQHAGESGEHALAGRVSRRRRIPRVLANNCTRTQGLESSTAIGQERIQSMQAYAVDPHSDLVSSVDLFNNKRRARQMDGARRRAVGLDVRRLRDGHVSARRAKRARRAAAVARRREHRGDRMVRRHHGGVSHRRGDRRRRVRLAGRSHRPRAGDVAEHLHLRRVHRPVRLRHAGLAHRRVAVHRLARHGRRMGARRGAGHRNLARPLAGVSGRADRRGRQRRLSARRADQSRAGELHRTASAICCSNSACRKASSTRCSAAKAGG